jgi:hypothetical protein
MDDDGQADRQPSQVLPMKEGVLRMNSPPSLKGYYPGAIAVDKLQILGVGWRTRLKPYENEDGLRLRVVAREDGAKPALPRNCERYEICEHH